MSHNLGGIRRRDPGVQPQGGDKAIRKRTSATGGRPVRGLLHH